ncbi:hypothetical protein G3I76_09635, partial [Streptomyces sp. SID11233]|nr:hypothetical protein [Streptomyces sp. SID11233]
LTMATPAVGAASGALSAWSRRMVDRTEVVMGRAVRVREKAGARFAVTRSSAEVDAAALLLRRIAATADSSGPWTTDLVVRSHRDHAVA